MTDGDAPRRGRGRPRREGTDELVLDAAIRLLQQRSYTSITLESVGVAAGVAKTTLYRRWSSKAALVIDAIRASLPAAAELRSDSFAVLVLSVARRVHALLTLHGSTLNALVVEAGHDREIVDSVKRLLLPDAWREAIDRTDTTQPLRDDAIDAVIGLLWFRIAVLGESVGADALERIAARAVR